MKTKTLLITVALGLSVIPLLAQDTPASPRGGPGPGPRGPRQPPGIMGVLDANRDGKIDATEIANAAEALKTLDKNGDGELTPDEFGGGPRPGAGPRGFGDGPGRRPGPRNQQ